MSDTSIYGVWDGIFPAGCDEVVLTSVPVPAPVVNNNYNGSFAIEVDGLSATYYIGFGGNAQISRLMRPLPSTLHRQSPSL